SALIRNTLQTAFCEQAITRGFYGVGVDVGSKYFNIEWFVVGCQLLMKQYGEGIGFFASGAGRHPYAQWLFRFGRTDKPGNNLVFQQVERFDIPEKTGYPNEQI